MTTLTMRKKSSRLRRRRLELLAHSPPLLFMNVDEFYKTHVHIYLSIDY